LSELRALNEDCKRDERPWHCLATGDQCRPASDPGAALDGR
jgi:hypothetical protein